MSVLLDPPTTASSSPGDPGRPAADRAPQDLARALSLRLGQDRVSTLLEDRLAVARDMWPRGLLAIAAGEPPRHPPEVVVWPTSTAEVQEVIRVCRAHGAPLVPFGAGSGVCGGAVPRGGVVLDTKRMRRVWVSPEEHTVTFEPGVLGWHLEQHLNRQGLSMGHFPSSIMCSTAGGWVAARGAGQCSTRYGKIEDMIRSAEVVTGTAEVIQLSATAPGPDLLQTIVGSEGTLGVLTKASCALRPLPEARRMRGWSFPQVEAGCQAIRRVLQRGLRPAVVRLYDELDTLISLAGAARGEDVPRLPPGPGPDAPGTTGLPVTLEDWLEMLRPDVHRAGQGLQRWLVGAALGRPGVVQLLNRVVDRVVPRLSRGCLLILGFEGDAALSAAEERAAATELLAAGGRDLGPDPGEHWLRHRYDVSFKMPKAFAAGAFTDTMEVAVTWDRLLELYHAVRRAVAPHAFVMAHFSHAYVEGCSIYFTFAGRRSATEARRLGSFAGARLDRPDRPDAAALLREDELRYDAMWQAALSAVVWCGGTISHHHGVGQLKAPFMGDEHGPGLLLLRGLKQALDPDNILNPGKLGLSQREPE